MVADPRGGTAFVPNGDRGIDAVDLETGKVLWTTKEAVTPLLLARDRLVALANIEDRKTKVQLVVLDVSEKGKGKRVVTSQPIELSQGLSLRRPEIAVDKGDVLLKWYRSDFIRRGKVSGTLVEMKLVRIDLATGRVERLPGKDLPAPALPDAVKSLKVPLDVDSQGYHFRSIPLIVGSKVAVVFEEVSSGEKRIEVGDTVQTVMRRWNLASGKEHKPVVLLRTEGSRVKVSPDKRYVFTPILRDGGADWTIFSLETGRQVGKVWAAGISDAGVLGPRVYFEVGSDQGGNFVSAHDLASGKSLWKVKAGNQRP
jgi:hypothetical protein